MKKVKIEKNIPIPKKVRQFNSKWRIVHEMDFGDSIGNLSKQDAATIRATIKRIGAIPIVRKTANGTYRIWKTST